MYYICFWCCQHPWMTFIIIMFFILAVNDSIADWMKTKSKK